MRIKTELLIGKELDEAVAHAIKKTFNAGEYSPSVSWADCGPLIEKYKIYISPPIKNDTNPKLKLWSAFLCDYGLESGMEGSTPQLAICRAVIHALVGSDVEFPHRPLYASESIRNAVLNMNVTL